MKSLQSRSKLVIGGLLVAAIALLAVVVVVANSPSANDAGAITPAVPGEVYDPVRAGEELPAGYRPLLDRDSIEPVYNPVFVTASEVDWPSDSLVIGVAGESLAKAYPVTHLNSREMVIDSLEGIPILVSW